MPVKVIPFTTGIQQFVQQNGTQLHPPELFIGPVRLPGIFRRGCQKEINPAQPHHCAKIFFQGYGSPGCIYILVVMSAGSELAEIDLAGPLLFLASPASDFYTGHILYADGGYTAG